MTSGSNARPPLAAALNVRTAESKVLVLFLGPKWWGSDARALACAFRHMGHALIEVDLEDYFPPRWSTFWLRMIRRFLRALSAGNYNAHLRAHLRNRAIDFVLVFKGSFVEPSVLAAFREQGVPLYCFYPDLGFFGYGPNIWKCLPMYDCVFTTKAYHLTDPQIRRRFRDCRLVQHAYDPDVHRPLDLSPKVVAQYECDLSFVGCWSPQKEHLITGLIHGLPGRDLRIWGPGWAHAATAARARWQGRGAYGDELAIIYQASRINLGLLSEAGRKDPMGDQTTARTWQIPACRAFLLHEDTDEVARFFSAGSEIVAFASPSDLVTKARYYLEHEAERRSIAEAGFRRAHESHYDYENAAHEILAYHSAKARA